MRHPLPLWVKPVDHGKSLMSAAVFVEADPIADDACGVLDAFETVSVCSLFLQFPDIALHPPVVLRAMWRNELLLLTNAVKRARRTFKYKSTL